MKLFEHQSASLFREFGIPVPEARTASDPDGAAVIARKFGGVCVVKAQVLSGGRGKAGGVKLVSSPAEAREAAEKIFAITVQGMPVGTVQVSRAVEIEKEFYAGMTLNRNTRGVEFMFSAEGGVDIEETAANHPEKIIRLPVDPFHGVDDTLLRGALGPFFDAGLLDRAVSIIRNMGRLFFEKDCSLVEINPLALSSGSLVAVDAKIVIDDNSLVKNADLEAFRNPEEYGRDEIDARNAGLSFVGLDGDIGCMVNGAGLAMATMDLIKHFGGFPANFLDIGGSSNPQKVVDALEILLRNKKIRAILMNIFGGITRCDDVARGVILASEKIAIPVPFVIRLIGTNDELGRSMLKEAGFSAYSDLNDAVRRVIEDAGRGRKG